jgi:hypothetical protein
LQAKAMMQLANAARRFGDHAVLSAVAFQVARMEEGMIPGLEKEHLRAMVLKAHHRGTDVRLSTGEALAENRQEYPYPAYRWLWKTQMSWPWRHEQHINILEMAAFLTHSRRRARMSQCRGKRYLHIVDSKVTANVVAKGRSSSRRLNRLARRLMAVDLATDCYPLVLWTISDWNFSDEASRRFERPPRLRSRDAGVSR